VTARSFISQQDRACVRVYHGRYPFSFHNPPVHLAPATSPALSLVAFTSTSREVPALRELVYFCSRSPADRSTRIPKNMRRERPETVDTEFRTAYVILESAEDAGADEAVRIRWWSEYLHQRSRHAKRELARCYRFGSRSLVNKSPQIPLHSSCP
jgi:hypothetical protein